MIRKAIRLQTQGRPDEAIPLFLTALETLRDHERVHVLSRLGLCCLALGKTAQGRSHLEEAVLLSPGDATAWLNYGRACQEVGDTVTCDEAYQKANEMAPNRPDILYHLATYYALKYSRAALEAAKRAARATREFLEKPGGPEELRYLGFPAELPLVLLRNLGLEGTDPEEAASFLRQMSEEPSRPATRWIRPAALLHLGLLLANRGEYDRAIRAYRSALEADAAILPAHFNLAMTLARQKRADEAERELRLYASRDPLSPAVSFGHAALAEARGDAAGAVRGYQEALDRHARRPLSPAVLARLDMPRGWVRQSFQFLRSLGAAPPESHDDEQWTGSLPL